MEEFLNEVPISAILVCCSGIFSGMLAALSSKTKDKIYPNEKYSFIPLFQFICLMGVWSIFPTILLILLIDFKFGIISLIITFIIYKVLSRFEGKFMLPNFIDGILFIWSLFIFWILSFGVLDLYKVFSSSWSEGIKMSVSLLICFVFLLLLSIFLPNSIVNKLKKILKYEFK